MFSESEVVWFSFALGVEDILQLDDRYYQGLVTMSTCLHALYRYFEIGCCEAE